MQLLIARQRARSLARQVAPGVDYSAPGVASMPPHMEPATPSNGTRPRPRTGPALRSIASNVKLLRESAVVDGRRPRTDPLLPRGVERLLLRLLGRPVACAECGRELFRALPLVWRGELWIIGGYDHVVRAEFNSSETLQFRHCQLDECPSAERPWVA
jgi:hypothetical protein